MESISRRSPLAFLPALWLGLAACSRSRSPHDSALSTPRNACLPADDHSRYYVEAARALGAGSDRGTVAVRAASKLPVLASPSQVQQVTAGAVCAVASSAYDSVYSLKYGVPRKPDRLVYVMQYGSLYLVGDPQVRGGEFFPMVLFSATFAPLGAVDF